jgi:K+-sensing histidine kinase KdpD
VNDDDRWERNLWIGIGGVVPLFVGGALVGLRNVMLNANVALVLVAAVVLVAAAGGRHAGAAAAVTAALSFDFFFTKPYLHLRIASRDDIETTVLLLVVGLLVGHVASRGRRARTSVEATRGEIKRIHRVAELGARGEDAADVVLAAGAELTALLRLRSCRFEPMPFEADLPELERNGTLATTEFHYRDGGFELPAGGVGLPVLGRGQLLGRFVLEPAPATGVTLEERVVAVALADQVGAVLAASPVL